uniref:N-acetylgalactosamine 6-sulfate sulfatase n=1 Tax=Schlesneria paludicola TaxID=360056 RepID=A0A7C2K380_9PLAN
MASNHSMLTRLCASAVSAVRSSRRVGALARLTRPWHAVIAVVVIASTLCAAEPPRPNIVLAMADDQGWGDMAYNGHPVLQTPVFDEMARTGLRLDRFYAAAPVCSPTRFSVMTGRTPNRSGVFSWGHAIRPQEITVAEALRSAGYATGHFGKWHLGSTLKGQPTSPGANGFDRWLSAPNFFEVHPWLSDEGTAKQFDGESSQIVVDAALEFMRKTIDARRPFLTVVWFGSPHAPHVGTEADRALYPDAAPKQRNFLAEITAMDRAMGRLRDGLRSLGVADNTLLWYCSDNGAIPEGSTGGLRGKKGQIYEGGLRVPCLIEWPNRIRTPRQSDLPCGTVDIYPTLVELTGAKVDHQPPVDGVSLVGLFDGTLTTRSKPLGFWEAGVPGISSPSDRILSALAKKQAANEDLTGDAAEGAPPAKLEWTDGPQQFAGHAAWIDGDWKLHRIQPKRANEPRWELYNLRDDFAEQQNVLDSQADRASRMQAALEAWLHSVTDSLRGKDYPPE